MSRGARSCGEAHQGQSWQSQSPGFGGDGGYAGFEGDGSYAGFKGDDDGYDDAAPAAPGARNTIQKAPSVYNGFDGENRNSYAGRAER